MVVDDGRLMFLSTFLVAGANSNYIIGHLCEKGTLAQTAQHIILVTVKVKKLK